MFFKASLVCVIACAISRASVEDLFECWPNPILIGRWQIIISREADTYSARTSFLSDIYPGRRPEEHVFEIAYEAGEETIRLSARDFEFEIYPRQPLPTYDGKQGVRAQAIDVKFAERARLRDQEFSCLRKSESE